MSATHRAVEQIRHLIFTGELTADSNHLESELADRLGISRTPVREATLMLQASGLVEVQPRKGVHIKAISIEEISDIYLVLTEMECLAARLAAQLQYSANELSDLKAAIAGLDASLEKQDADAWAVSDEAFHVALVQLSENNHLQTTILNFYDQVRRARSITLHMRPVPNQSSTDHKALYHAILAADATLADSIHRRHRNKSRKMLIDILEQSGLNRV